MTTPEQSASEPGLNERPAQTFEELCNHEQLVLDEILNDVEFLSLRQSFHQAANRFGEFRRDLERHIETEERLALPLFTARTGDPNHVVERIREEHRRLAELVAAVATSISQWERARFIAEVAELRAALKVHHQDEEARLNPALGLRTSAAWHLPCRCESTGIAPA